MAENHRLLIRRQVVKGLLALPFGSLLAPKMSHAKSASITKRPIPSTGENVPAVGLGTWQTFTLTQKTASAAVLQRFIDLGGTVIDTSPMYGEAERAIGVIATELGLLNDLFVATKVWTRGATQGRKQIAQSRALLKKNPVDLYQIHNLVDWQTQLKTLRAMKDKGEIRYIGITHYVSSSHAELEQIIAKEKIDFLQINYNIAARNADKSLFRVAQDRGVAVLINRPYATGNLFSRVRGQPLPGWASDIDCHSFGQIFLKFILGHPAVTCVIPATSKVHHLEDNLAAALGQMPDTAMRNRMQDWFDSL